MCLVQIYNTKIMDYQCIVVYTIVRICPFYPYDSNCLQKRRNGCFQWVKTHVKRFDFVSHIYYIYIIQSNNSIRVSSILFLAKSPEYNVENQANHELLCTQNYKIQMIRIYH